MASYRRIEAGDVGGSSYGSPPYHESAARAALRYLGVGLQGLSAVPRGANFGEAFLASAGGAARASQAAQQAAQEYAMKQAEAERKTQEDEIQKRYMEAQMKALEKPEKPVVPEPWQMDEPTYAKYLQSQEDLERIKNKYKAEKGGGAGSSEMPGLSNEALDAAAQRYALTGVMPSMGMGKQAAAYRAEIMNRAGKKYPSANIAANLADYRKDSASISNVQRIRDAAAAWENTAGKNADVALKALQGVPDLGNRFGNKVVRFLASQGGSPQMAAFNAARETIKVEYARLLSSPGVANGVLSDAARKEVENIISGDLTKPQLIRALKVLKQDASNRRASYDKQLREIQGRIRGNPVGAMSTLPAPQQNQGGGQNWVYDPDTQEMVPAP